MMTAQRPTLIQSMTAATLIVALAAPAPASIPPLATAALTNAYTVALPESLQSETLVYEFGWAGIPAAEATWTATRRKDTTGEWMDIKGTARTNAAVSFFWKMRDEVEATVATDGAMRPESYRLSQKENALRRVTTLDFDHADGTVAVHRNEKKDGDPKTMDRTDPVEGQYDPVSAAMALRGLPLEEGRELSLEVLTGKSLYRLDVAVLGREKVRAAGREWDAWVVSPRIFNITENGPNPKFKTAKIWISDDATRIPLKVESEVFIGSVYAELIKR